MYRYLVKRKYFKLVRQLLEDKVPPLYDIVVSPPNSISDTLLQMIQHPLRLMSATDKPTNIDQTIVNKSAASPPFLISDECATLILSSFVEEILVPEYTKPIRLFLIPCLANSIEFPFTHLLQYLSELIKQECVNQDISVSAQQNNEYSISSDSSVSVSMAREKLKAIDKVFSSTYVFHSFLTLDQLNLERIKGNSMLIRNYINVLGSLSENIRKLQQSSSHPRFRQYDMDVEPDDDSDDDEEEENDRKIETISVIERDCLFEVITMLNDEKRVELVLDNIDDYLDDVQVLYALCKICHNLMLYHRKAVSEFRCVDLDFLCID